MQVALLLLAVGFSVASLLIGRWWIAILAVVTFAGLAIFTLVTEGWEGADWGEPGLYWAVLVGVLAVAGSATGVAINRLTRDLLTRPSDPD